MLIFGLLYAGMIGACVGSFLNVVIYRLPEGKSVVSPPSSCPKCGHGLAWYDNVPILGWIWLKGKCRYCSNPISIQYPIIEAVCALLIVALYFVYYMTSMRPDFAAPGLIGTWMVFIGHGVLISGLLAATIIDARLFIIPLGIPWTVILVAAILLPISVVVNPDAIVEVSVPAMAFLSTIPEPFNNSASVYHAVARGYQAVVEVSAVPLTGVKGMGLAFGGIIGLVLANVLMRWRIIPRSFDEPLPESESSSTEQTAATPEEQIDEYINYPFARREILKECLFVAIPLLVALIGYWLVPEDLGLGAASNAVRALAGVCLGVLGGGAVVWVIRILGSLAFGKEAMGLGDVHLMAAVGAICGWEVAVLGFFVAPFIGLLFILFVYGLSKAMHRQWTPIPYGPHLAMGTFVVMIWREPLLSYFGVLMGL